MGNKARNKVLVLHRRAGKTALAVNQLIIEAMKPENAGRTFWYIAPTYAQGKEVVWADPRMLFNFLPEALIEKKNESELWVKTFNNTRIAIKGGEEPDTLLGADPYGVIVDETQNQKEELYSRILRPILAANRGWIWFLGTPRYKDHFFQKAVYADSHPDWQYYHLSALTSGVIGLDELDEIRQNTPEDIFRQDYLAEFLDGEGVVFRNVRELAVYPMEDPIDGHTYSIGVDLARKSDFTVLTVYDQSTRRVVCIERFNNIDWSFQKAKIEALARRYQTHGRPSRLKVDSTGVGDPIYQDLRDAGLFVNPVVFTNKLKEEMIQGLRIMFDHKTIFLPRYKPLIDELEVFEQTVLGSGRSRFAAPEGMDFHDDCVFSLALAVYQAPFIENQFEKKKKSLLMNKYRQPDINRYAKSPKSVYRLSDLS